MRRDRLEAELTAAQLREVRRLTEWYLWPFDLWPELPRCRSYIDQAVIRYADRLMAGGVAEQPAVERAGAYMGVSGESMLRSRREYRRGLADKRKDLPPGSGPAGVR